MGKHAVLAPSSAARWTTCTASPGAQAGLPNLGSEAARFGTCGHQIHEECLKDDTIDPQDYVGRKMAFWSHPESDCYGEDWLDEISGTEDRGLAVLHVVDVTQEMVDGVVTSLNFIRQIVQLNGGELLVEQAVPIGHFTGEEGAVGHADAILMTPKVLHTFDLKMGRHKVHAYTIVQPAGIDPITGDPVPEIVQMNLQLACYALGALEAHGLLYDFESVSATVVQPLLGHVSEYSCSVAELLQLRDFLQRQAEETRTNPVFRPSSEACRFCLACGNCEPQTRMVAEAALIGFDDVREAKPRPVNEMTLGTAYALLPLVRTWAQAVEDRTRAALQEGQPVVRSDGLAYKLVEGRNTARDWADEQEAEAAMERMRLRTDLMYTRKLISPTQAEKLAKTKRAKKGETPEPPVIGKTQWNKLQELITQGEGQPTIVLETDPQPAMSGATDGFEDVADNSDLF